jgi:hypothetical protein
MPEINYLAALAATVGAFVVSGIWYAVFGQALVHAQPASEAPAKMAPWQLAVEILRSAIVALAVAYLFATLRPEGWLAAAGFGIILWLAFPAVLLLGSVVHEKVRTQVAAIHAGDWLVKLVVITIIVGLWR